MDLKKFIIFLLSPSVLAKKLLMWFLFYLHDMTKYYDATGYPAMFYWPEGICANMFVVAGILTLAIVIITEDCSYIQKLFNESKHIHFKN